MRKTAKAPLRGQLITITMFIIALAILVSSMSMTLTSRRTFEGQALEEMDVDRLKMIEVVARANYRALPSKDLTGVWLASHHALAAEQGVDFAFESQQNFNVVTLRAARTNNTISFLLEKK